MIRRAITAVLVLLLIGALFPQSASAQVDDWIQRASDWGFDTLQDASGDRGFGEITSPIEADDSVPDSVAPLQGSVDTWRILHIGLQSGASVDTDGDGVVNSWGCRSRGGRVNCNQSALYQQWQTDIGCLKPTLEAWSDYQINVRQRSVFISTTDYVTNDPYSMERYESTYDFESYDVVMVWTAYTQATGWDGGTWNGVTGGYSYIGLYGVAGQCPDSSNSAPWPAVVPAHEFVHSVVGLYMNFGYPVCGTYEYPYGNYGEWEGHHMILTNTFPATTCASGIVSTGVPAEAWASGSWVDHYD